MFSNPDVIKRMDDYLSSWTVNDDPRCVFLQCYRAMTGNMLNAIEEGFFDDREWVSQLLHHFADYYFDALYCHECGDVTPKVWQHVYKHSEGLDLHPMQLLLMGVNAHINYDLVFALRDMLVDEWQEATPEHRSLRYAEHMRVNEVIANTIDQVQDEVIEPGHPMMAVLDSMMGRLDEYLLSRLITSWRSQVWDNAVRMLECSTDQTQVKLQKELEAEVMRTGSLVAGIW